VVQYELVLSGFYEHLVQFDAQVRHLTLVVFYVSITVIGNVVAGHDGLLNIMIF